MLSRISEHQHLSCNNCRGFDLCAGDVHWKFVRRIEIRLHCGGSALTKHTYNNISNAIDFCVEGRCKNKSCALMIRRHLTTTAHQFGRRHLTSGARCNGTVVRNGMCCMLCVTRVFLTVASMESRSNVPLLCTMQSAQFVREENERTAMR